MASVLVRPGLTYVTCDPTTLTIALPCLQSFSPSSGVRSRRPAWDRLGHSRSPNF